MMSYDAVKVVRLECRALLVGKADWWSKGRLRRDGKRNLYDAAVLDENAFCH